MLADKTLILAGAGNGLGRHAAEHLAELGASVVVNDLGASVTGEGADPAVAEEVAETIAESGGDAISHHGDVADPDDATELIETAVDEYDRVDGIANFAGILRDGWIANLSDDDWAEALRANLGTNFALLRAAVRHWRGFEEPLAEQRAYLAMSSMGALGNPGQLNYSASKAGVLGFVRSASTELWDQNVRVNALIPSGFTRMTATVPEEHRPYTREEMPPERVAPMVAYLLADAAEDVTGCTLYAGGDRIGIFTDPEMERSAFQPGGWTAEGIAEQMEGDLAADVDLTRTERYL